MDGSVLQQPVGPRPLVEIRDLTVNFVSREATVAAVLAALRERGVVFLPRGVVLAS